MGEFSPLHVLLTAMRRKWRDGDEEGAVALAKAAAPYVHPRAAAARPPSDLAQVSDDELDDGGPGDGPGGGAGAADGCAGLLG